MIVRLTIYKIGPLPEVVTRKVLPAPNRSTDADKAATELIKEAAKTLAYPGVGPEHRRYRVDIFATDETWTPTRSQMGYIKKSEGFVREPDKEQR
jgi:hypothetical protein